MKRKAILLGVLSMFVASQAGAKILDTWTRISIQFTNLGRAEASDTGVGVTTLNTSGSGMHLNTMSMGYGADGLPGLSLNTILPVTDPIVSGDGVISVRLTNVRGRADGIPGPQMAPGVLAPISGAIQSTTTPRSAGGIGTIPSSGMVRICAATGCPFPQYLPLNVGETNNGVANGGSAGGLLTIGGLGDIRISISGAPYTVKTISAFNRTDNGGIETFTEKGFAHGPASMTSSTGMSTGVLQVVTANHTTTVGIAGNSDVSGQFSRIYVHFMPEPGLLLLLGSGAVGMALLGRKRFRK